MRGLNGFHVVKPKGFTTEIEIMGSTKNNDDNEYHNNNNNNNSKSCTLQENFKR